MNDLQLREKLAELEHEQWVHWTKYFIENIHLGECVERWKNQIKTPYKDLSEKEKDSDRKWADKIFAIITKHNYESAFKSAKEHLLESDPKKEENENEKVRK